MKHTDNELQAAIDWAMLATGAWREDPSDRLALAKAFLAKLPEAQPILADDGRSLGQVAFEAWGNVPEDWHRSLTQNWQASAQAVAAVVLAQAIRRMEAVPVDDLTKAYWNHLEAVQTGDGLKRARARLIAAVKGEGQAQEVPQVVHVNTTGCEPMTEKTAQAIGAMVKAAKEVGINGLTAEEEAKTASVAGLSKPETSTTVSNTFFKAHGHIWTRHTPGDPMPCDGDAIVEVMLQRQIDQLDSKHLPMKARHWNWGELQHCPMKQIIGWRYADEPDSTDWKARAEKAEAELAALKSSTIGVLRPLSEAGPVPDGCVRMLGNNKTDGKWTLATWEDEYDTHFADILLPVTETPAQDVNKQPKQQVPLGPEQKLQAIKDILEIK